MFVAQGPEQNAGVSYIALHVAYYPVSIRLVYES